MWEIERRVIRFLAGKILRRRRLLSALLLRWRMKILSRSWFDLHRSRSVLLPCRPWCVVVNVQFVCEESLNRSSILTQTLVDEVSDIAERERVMAMSLQMESLLERLLVAVRLSRSLSMGDPVAIAEDVRVIEGHLEEIAEDGGEIHDEGENHGDD